MTPLENTRDPEAVERNKRRYPVDDPPGCERLGCGHSIDLHFYSLTADQRDEHNECSLGCGCPRPLYPERKNPRD